MPVTKKPSNFVTCHFSLFVALCDLNPAPLLTDRQIDDFFTNGEADRATDR